MTREIEESWASLGGESKFQVVRRAILRRPIEYLIGPHIDEDIILTRLLNLNRSVNDALYSEVANSGWSDWRTAALKVLWVNEIKATPISKILGRVTRNAVIGKVHRLHTLTSESDNTSAGLLEKNLDKIDFDFPVLIGNRAEINHRDCSEIFKSIVDILYNIDPAESEDIDIDIALELDKVSCTSARLFSNEGKLKTFLIEADSWWGLLGEEWVGWKSWYLERIRSINVNPSLENEKANFLNTHLDESPSFINQKINELTLRYSPSHQEKLSPQAVAVVYSNERGTIGYQIVPPSPEEAYENLLQKVTDRVERCWQGHNRLSDLIKDDLDEILTDLSRVLESYANKPWRVHDDFSTAVVNLTALDGAESELRIRNLLRDLQDAVSDLRELVPELRDKVTARVATRIGLPDEDVLLAFEILIDALGDAGEADLVQELRDHLATLKKARKENPDDDGAPMEEGAVKDAAYSEGGLWIRIRNRADEVARSMGKGANASAETTQKAAKVLDAAEKIGKHWKKIEPWIVGWF